VTEYYIEGFAGYLELERSASNNTITSYVRDVTQFSRYLLESEDVELPQAETEHIERYISAMAGKGKSAASIARSVASLKSYYGYLHNRGVIRCNPAKDAAPVKTERKLPQILTGKEVELFLDQPQCVDPKGYRDHAMLELLYATGIRVSELIGLNVGDVNLVGSFIRCASRGKERIIPLYSGAVKALGDYMKDVRGQLVLDPRERALFVNMSGERMSRQGFWKIIKYYQEKAQQRYHAPHPAPLLCGSPAGKRSGPPFHSGDAGARGHFFYADLFSYGQTEAAGCVS
jgi:integrase/recombinase XerD